MLRWRLPALCLALCVFVESACTHTAGGSTQASAEAVDTAAHVAASALLNAEPVAGDALTSSGQPDVGPGVIEDGIAAPGAGASTGAAVQSVGETAAGLLSAGNEPAPVATADPLVTLVRRSNDALPASEYSLAALSQTEPSGPSALDSFVRDSTGLDLYDGVLRGALGTWLGRAGNPTDKLLLVAAMLRAKHVAFQFVSGTLSDTRSQIIDEAKSAPRFIVEPSDARQKGTSNRGRMRADSSQRGSRGNFSPISPHRAMRFRRPTSGSA
jgi:hypothetical protein